MSVAILFFMDQEDMTPDNLIAFLVVFSQIIQPAKNITTAYFAIQKGMASIDRIDQVLDAEETITEKAECNFCQWI